MREATRGGSASGNPSSKQSEPKSGVLIVRRRDAVRDYLINRFYKWNFPQLPALQSSLIPAWASSSELAFICLTFSRQCRAPIQTSKRKLSFLSGRTIVTELNSPSFESAQSERPPSGCIIRNSPRKALVLSTPSFVDSNLRCHTKSPKLPSVRSLCGVPPHYWVDRGISRVRLTLTSITLFGGSARKAKKKNNNKKIKATTTYNCRSGADTKKYDICFVYIYLKGPFLFRSGLPLLVEDGMMAITTNMHSNGVNGATANLSKVQKATRQSHIHNLSRLATLSTQIISSDSPHTPPDETHSTVDEIISHGATTTFFGEILALIQAGELTREELDQKLLNWILTIPGARKTFERFDSRTKGHIQEFRRADLRKGKGDSTVGVRFKRPHTLKIHHCVQELRDSYEEQLKIDGGKLYPSVVENDGRPVRYINKKTFQNWGDTVETKPSVHPAFSTS